MTGELWVVVGGGKAAAVLEEGHRVADLLGEAGDRPAVVAVTFDGQDTGDALDTVPPDEVVRLVPESGRFRQGAASTPDRVGALVELADERPPRAVLTPSTPDGDDLVARLATRIDGGCVTDCLVRVREDRLLAGRVVYEGRAYGEFDFEGATPVVSVNADVLGSPDPGRDRDPTVVERAVSLDGGGVEHVETLEIPEQDLSKARRIVSGGKGLGDPEGFEVIENLADALGAALGASRPPADDGWVPYDRQIGVTGKEIDARLYLACAISGDPYHMRSVAADHLLAINTDPGARIFSFTDFGVVGDVYEFAPAIAEAVRAARDGEKAGTEPIEADGGEP